MNIAIIPPHDAFWNNNLFDIKKGRDNLLELYVSLRSRLLLDGHKIETIDMYNNFEEIDLIIFNGLTFAWSWLLKCIKVNPNVIIINYAAEPTIIQSLNSKPVMGIE